MGLKNYGNTAGPSGVTFQTYIEFRVTQQSETQSYVQYKYAIYCTGNWSVTTYCSRSWASSTVLLKSGFVGDSGWKNLGWVTYGKSTGTITGSAWYTGGSGAQYKSTCSASYTPPTPTWVPKAVTNAKAVRNSSSQATVSWTDNPTTARPYSGVYVDRSVDGGSYARLATAGATATSYVDTTIQPNHTYAYRLTPYNSAGSASAATTGTITNPPNAPAAPTGVTNTRNSDAKNTLAWTNNPTSDAPYDTIHIERRTLGGAWSQVATISGTTTTYVDSTTYADSYYAYRVRAYNTGGYSDYALSGVTYNTPAAPTKVVGARSSDTVVVLTITNPAHTASALEVQVSTDKSTWTSVGTYPGTVTTVTTEPGGGTFYYRARNTRGSLASAWSPVSAAVVTICAPAAPTLKSPASSAIVNVTQSTIELQWAHNPIDGSAQTAAMVRFSTDGSAWTYVQLNGSAQSCGLQNGFSNNATVYWSVRTKGAHDDWGPWSGNRTFVIRTSPQVAVLSPDGTIDNVPVEILCSYTDASGSLASLAVSITDLTTGTVVWSKSLGTKTSCEVTKDEWLPTDGRSYRITASARSTSSLTSTAHATVLVEFDLPQRCSLRVVPDPERGWVELTPIVNVNDDGVAVESMSVWRVTRAGEVLLASDLSDRSTIVDKYAPLNTAFEYKIVGFAASGASRPTLVDGSVKTPYAFFYFSLDGEEQIARVRYNPTENRNPKRANRTIVHYAGRDLPVLYDAGGYDETRALTALIKGDDEAAQFELLKNVGRAIYKSVKGDVIHCAADASLTPRLTSYGERWDLDVEVTRVDGDLL